MATGDPMCARCGQYMYGVTHYCSPVLTPHPPPKVERLTEEEIAALEHLITFMCINDGDGHFDTDIDGLNFARAVEREVLRKLGVSDE